MIMPRHQALLSNRSAAYYALGDYGSSLKDAKLCVEINNNWEKGYFRKCKALDALERYAEARVAAEDCLKLNPKAKETIDLLGEIAKKDDELYYQQLTAGSNVEIKHLEREKGKGTFSKKDFSFGQVVFTENPIAYFRTVGEAEHIDCCSYCLKTIPTRTIFKPHEQIFDFIFQGQSPPQSKLFCPKNCQTLYEVYCSESCQKTAWETYHRLLCPKARPEIADHVKKLIANCQNVKRTNPLVVARIFSTVANMNEKGIDPRIAFRPYQRFISYEASAPGDQEAFDYIKAIFAPFQNLQESVTLQNFRHLNGAMLRNAQSIHPFGPLHQYIENGTDEQREEILSLFNLSLKQLDEFRTGSYLAGLTAPGSGLFPIANCTNHSCLPNVASVSQHLDRKIDLVAIREIKAGDEIHISYIDETMPIEQRQKELLKLYLFNCKCEKCLTGK